MSSLGLRGVRKAFGAQAILAGVDLEVADGAFVVLVGPSGCGKSTLLRVIAGLEQPDAGTVMLGSREVTHAEPRERDVAMVFQSYALYPHLSVRENIAFGLRLRKTPEATVRTRIDETARMLGLEALLDRLPRQLSGGQRQRVAMARAIARRPALFLFDEPLSNLDAALRGQVRVEIKKLHADLGATMVYVTHDQVEAMTLADRLVILNAGRIEQQGPPLEVYANPATRFVAAFLGSPAMNFLPAEVGAGGGVLEGKGFSLPLDPVRFAGLEQGRRVLAGVRPQDVSIATNETTGSTLAFDVDVLEAMGFEAYAHGRVGPVAAVARLEGSATLPPSGTQITLTVRAEHVHVFDADTERTLSTLVERPRP